MPEIQRLSNQINDKKNINENLFDYHPTQVQGKTNICVINQDNHLRNISMDKESIKVQNLNYTIYENQECLSEFTIEWQEFLYINPYIVQVTNNSLLTIISTYELNKRHIFSLNNSKYSVLSLILNVDFLCFAEMYGGSLKIGEKTFYQSSSIMFLTMEEIHSEIKQQNSNETTASKRVVCLNILELPQRFDCEGQTQEIYNLYTFDKEKFSIDSRSLRKEKIIKCYIDLLDVQEKNIRPLLVFIQYPNNLHVESLNAHLYNKRFTVNRGIEMIKFREKNLMRKEKELTQQNSSRHYNSKQQPQFIVVCRDGEDSNDLIKKIVFEEDVPPTLENIHEFTNDQKIISLKLIKDTLIALDEKLRVLRIKLDNSAMSVQSIKMTELTPLAKIQWKRQSKLNSKIVITDSEVYFGHFYYQNSYNFQTLLDSNRMQLDFENKRNFKIPQMTYQNFIQGPLQSLDKSFLMYVKLKEIELEKEKQITQIKNEGSEREKSTVYINEEYLQEIYCLPLMGSKSINLIHQDDYLYQNIKFSSFTVNDDILILLGGEAKQKMFIFNSNGNPLPFNITPKNEQSIIEDGKIINIKTTINKQFFLIQVGENFHIAELEHEFIKQVGFKYTMNISKTYDKKMHEKLGLQDHYAQLDDKGNLYQLVIAEIPQSTSSCILYENNDPNVKITDKINQILNDLKPLEYKQQEAIKLIESEVVNGDPSPQKIKKPRKTVQYESSIDLINSSKIKGFLSRSKTESTHIETVKRYFDIDFTILNSKYLVIRRQKEIYFLDLKEDKSEFTRLNLNLRKGIISQMLQTQITHFLQFVYIQEATPSKSAFIFTWNLQTNMEESMLEVPINSEDNSQQISEKDRDSVKILKGVSERLNFFIPTQTEGYYDLRYNFPLHFLNCQSAKSQLLKKEQKQKRNYQNPNEINNQKEQQITICLPKYQQSLDELKFSSNALSVLGVTKYSMATIINSNSYLDLQYMQYLIQTIYSHDHLTLLQLEFLKFRLPDDGSNIIHILSLNEKFWQLYQKSIKAAIQEQELVKHQKAKINPESFYHAIIYPNNDDNTPIDIALEYSEYRAAEIMLDMLSQVQPKFNYSKYLQKHFITFLDLNSVIFDKFLATCTIKLNVDSSRKYQWRFTGNQQQLGFHTSYLDENFLNKYFQDPKQNSKMNIYPASSQRKQESSQLERQQTKTPQNEDEGFRYQWSKNENLFQRREKKNKTNQKVKSQNQSINFEIIEFPWVFEGSTAESFIQYLSNQEKGSKLFANPVIQHIILFQWRYFWRQFLYRRYIPFMFYFITILLYVTLTHEFATKDKIIKSRPYLQIIDGNPWTRPWDLGHIILGILIILQTAFSLYFEILKALQAGLSNHLMAEIVFYLFAIGLVIANFAGVDDTTFRIISVFLLMQCYFHFVLYLRLFDQTAVMVSMLFHITKDIMVFIVVFFVGIIAFANMLFIMQGIALNMGEMPSESTIVDQNFALAILATFNAVFGYFDTEVFKKYGSNQWLLWVIYVSLVLLLCLIMLNMIIALMQDTYTQVNALQKEERIMAKCRLIHENECIFNRKKLLSKFRYIIIAAVDRVTNDEVDSNKLLKNKIEKNHQEITSFIQSQAYVDQKLLDLVQINTDLESKINEMMSKITELQAQNSVFAQFKSSQQIISVPSTQPKLIKEYSVLQQ